MKETFVTGASGFLGSHLTERLDDFVSIPHKEIQNFENISFKRFFFLSTYGNMADQDNDSETLKANVQDLIHVINQTDWSSIESFVYISSSSVNLPHQTMYSRTKKAAEEILLSFAEKYNASITIIRPFSITGVGEQEKHLIPTLIRASLTGEKVDFVPEPAHDFIDVEDVVDGILFLSKKRARGIYELGSGEQYTNEEVLDIVEQVTGKKINVNIVRNLRPYDTQEWVSRNYRSRHMGWNPKKTLEQSISEMYEQIRKENYTN